jgi:hypothetical protein
MKVALVIVAALALIALVVMLLPLRLRMTLKGRGQYGDTWVIAGGLEFLKFTVTVAAAHATDRILQVHWFNWRVLLRRSSPKEPKGPELTLDQMIERVMTLRKSLEKRFDRDRLWRFVFGLRRHVRLRSFQGHLYYSTPDVAWTGMSSGILYAIAGLVSPFGQFAVVPEWEDVASARGDLDLVVRLWPARAAAATAWFVARNIRLREPVEVSANTEPPPLPAHP